MKDLLVFEEERSHFVGGGVTDDSKRGGQNLGLFLHLVLIKK